MTDRIPGETDEYRQQVQKSISFLGQGIDYFTEVKATRLLGLAATHLGDTSQLKALDVGCGVGLTDKFLAGHFRELHGVDVDASSLKSAAEANPDARYSLYDGRTLPYPDGAFDLVFAVNVLHHVKPSLWPGFVGEMRRVARPGGMAAIFEHNPINPLTRLAVRRCEFDGDATLLYHRRLRRLIAQSGMNPLDSAYVLFCPFRSRLLSRVESRLGWLPLGAQHYAAGRK